MNSNDDEDEKIIKLPCQNKKNCKATVKPGMEDGLCSDCFFNKYYKRCLHCKQGRLNKTARDTHLCSKCSPYEWVASEVVGKKKQVKKINVGLKKLGKREMLVNLDIDPNDIQLYDPMNFKK